MRYVHERMPDGGASCGKVTDWFIADTRPVDCPACLRRPKLHRDADGRPRCGYAGTIGEPVTCKRCLALDRFTPRALAVHAKHPEWTYGTLCDSFSSWRKIGEPVTCKSCLLALELRAERMIDADRATR